MAWRIGIDEAGYGPNLGPLVVTAVACEVPAEHVETNLWDLLRDGVRRKSEKDKTKLFIDDSKLVYAAPRGLAQLERSALAALGQLPSSCELVTRVCPDHELHLECWFTGLSTLPVAADADQLQADLTLLARVCCANDVRLSWIRSLIICPPRFNGIVGRYDSKGAVLGLALVQLVREAWGVQPIEDLHFIVDKHGGRNQYGHLLQEAFTDAWVLTREERNDESRYEVKGYERTIQARFMPRADSQHFVVALASIISKYLREVLMGEFNAFWKQHIPDLVPTAGYPSDAERFWRDIEPTVRKLGVPQEHLWRCR